MKSNATWVWLAALAVTVAPIAARADEGDGIQRSHSVLRSAWDNAVTVDPIDLFTGTMSVEYERAIGSRVGIYTGINLLVMRGWLVPSEAFHQYALGPELGARFYLIGRAPAGLWVGPYVNAAWVRTMDPSGPQYDSFGMGGGGMGGLNLLFGQFTLALGLGLGYRDLSPHTFTAEPGYAGLTPRLRLALGAVF